MPDNKSLEPLFNDDLSETDGIKRNLRIINPQNPVDGYHIADQETGVTSYYGYLNKDGAWYIQKAVRTGAEVNYTYKKGDSDYDWSARIDGTYAPFSDTF